MDSFTYRGQTYESEAAYWQIQAEYQQNQAEIDEKEGRFSLAEFRRLRAKDFQRKAEELT